MLHQKDKLEGWQGVRGWEAEVIMIRPMIGFLSLTALYFKSESIK